MRNLMMKIKSSFLRSGVGRAAVAGRKFLTAALLILSVSCSSFGQAPTPTPQVFDTPASEINTMALFFHEGCHFGGSVDFEGDLLVVGAPCWGRPPGEGAGTVYVLRRSSNGELVLDETLTASDRDDGFQYDQNFGMSVAFINETMIAIGVPGYDDPQVGDNTGAIYIFEYNGSDWVETGKLLASQRTSGARIGSTLASDGNLLATSGSPQAGSVVIFHLEGKGGWRELAPVPVFPSADGEPYEVRMGFYGDTLAISTVIQKQPADETDPKAVLLSLKTSGTVTLYERVGDEWQKTYQTAPQEASLYGMDASSFGLPVALGGEAGRATWLAVGKPGFAGSGRETGSVAIFERGDHGWKPQAELVLAYGEPVLGALLFFGHDPGPIFFGAFVRIEGNRLAVVSTFANTAYVFERQGQDWTYRSRLVPIKVNGETGDDFQTRTVAMNGNYLLMGSPGELEGGEVYLFNLQP
jgi:hypothetical protein